jgi:hypothetical protein
MISIVTTGDCFANKHYHQLRQRYFRIAITIDIIIIAFLTSNFYQEWQIGGCTYESSLLDLDYRGKSL